MSKLDKIGHELSKMKKGNPFVVPQRYFDNFSDRLHKRIHAEEERSVFYKLTHIYRTQFTYALSIAGVLLIVFISYNLFFQSPESGLQKEIAAHIQEEIYYYNEELMIEAIEDKAIYTKINYKEASALNTSDEIIEYLIYDDIDISSIIEEL